MANAGLTFKLFGEDVSASDALKGVEKTGKKVAGAVAAAFGAVAVGDILQGAFDTESTLAKFKATLGATPKVAKEAGELAGRLYRDGMGESLEEVTAAIGGIGTNMEDLSEYFGENAKYSAGELGGITEQALNLATALGVDVVDVTRAAGQMMRNGIAPDAAFAFDVLAKGAMDGTNAAGDLIETFTEYSPTFERIGVSSSDALAMMRSGLAAGIMDTDRAAVAFEDMLDLVTAGGKPAVDALGVLGLGADEMATKLAAGGPAAQEATGQIMTALRNLTDPQAQQTAGVALFGETWVTSGADAVLAMDPVLNKTNDIDDATKILGDTLNETAQHKVDRIKRSFDGWFESLVNTEGAMGDVAAFAVGLGPQIVGFAGSVGMVVLALKGVAGAAVAGISAAAVALAPIIAVVSAAVLSVLAVLQKIKEAFALIDQIKQWASGDLSNLKVPTWVGSVDLGKVKGAVGSSSLASRGNYYYNNASVAAAGAYNSSVSASVGRAASVWKFAKGGIVDRPTLAMIGEAGESEAVIPLSKWSQMTGGSGGDTFHIHMPQGLVVGTADEIVQKLADLVATARRRGTLADGAFA